jgi:5-formyltetrahydrofolate cyclo-ligase
MVHASAASAKSILRAQMKAVRAEAFRKGPGAGAAAAEHIPQFYLGRFSVVAGYQPMGSEIDPTPLLTRLAAEGAQIVLPRTAPKGSCLPLSFHPWSPGQSLVKSAFGVAEPGPDAPQLTPDLVIVPLLAFDDLGHRMGYGQGHYDRTLEALRARHPVVAIGLAFEAQRVASVPREDHDQPLDGILTQTRYMGLREDL